MKFRKLTIKRKIKKGLVMIHNHEDVGSSKAFALHIAIHSRNGLLVVLSVAKNHETVRIEILLQMHNRKVFNVSIIQPLHENIYWIHQEDIVPIVE